MSAIVILQTASGQTVAALPAGGADGLTSEHHRLATAAEIALYQPAGQSTKTVAQHAADRRAKTA
jgi:hypothetical protein